MFSTGVPPTPWAMRSFGPWAQAAERLSPSRWRHFTLGEPQLGSGGDGVGLALGLRTDYRPFQKLVGETDSHSSVCIYVLGAGLQNQTWSDVLAYWQCDLGQSSHALVSQLQRVILETLQP